MQQMQISRRLNYFSEITGSGLRKLGSLPAKTSVVTDGEIQRMQVEGIRKHREMVKVRLGDLSYFVLAYEAEKCLRPASRDMAVTT